VPKPLPKDVVKHWPEVFKDVDVETIPIQYLHSVRVTFKDGKIWDIDIEKSKQKTPGTNLETVLEDLFREYDKHIAGVDFKLDTERIKSDIQRRTKVFLKKNK
jgi:hypothetical protein